jgi:fucose 4-O-acetylase-like acetyltransferase
MRNNVIDIAKGIGIILVVWGHTACPIRPYFYIFHIPLFFILSGYFFKKEDFKTFTKKKVKSLIIPFIGFVFIQRIGLILTRIINGSFEMDHLLLWKPIYSPGTAIGPLWFFIALFLTSFFFYYINKLKNEVLIGLISLSLTYLGFFLYKSNIHLPMYFDSAISMVFPYYIGNKLHKIGFKKIKNWKLSLLISVLCVSIYSVIIFYYYCPTIDVYINVFGGIFFPTLILMIFGSFTIFMVSNLIDFIPNINTILGFVGRNSLVIFAVHKIFIHVVYDNIPHDQVNAYGGMIITVFAVIFSLLLNIPLKKYLPILRT